MMGECSLGVNSKAEQGQAPPQPSTVPVKIPVATSYDVDNEYDYIMGKALNAYEKHCDKEKAESRQRQILSSYRRRFYLATQKPPKPGGTSRPRPWSALPSKFDAIREVSQANCLHRESTPRKVLNVRTITLGSAMEASNAKTQATSYQKRNQTSTAWYSHSYPSATILGKHMQAQMVMRPQPAAGFSKRDKPRPESAQYHYDGGVFCNPKNPKRDFFVIHPDWVSESMTIQKLSLNERKARSQTWPGRRCRSAPPPKFRNPITWD